MALVLACAAVVAAAGCSGGSQGARGGETAEKSVETTSLHMAGPAQEVNISAAAVAAKPKPWVLKTPESAVRSYLDWTSYAYRIAQSGVATSTFSAYEEVRVDSYVQYNLQQGRVIDQTLDSITFGKPSISSTSATIPAKEKWTYRYVSITNVDQTVGGPYTASYDVTYTVVKSDGGWVVDSVNAKPQGTVK